jgi:geranylgeranyl reductase family protein
MAWILAKQGIKVALLERAVFPREKVCGDYVEPGGLRILDRIGALSAIERRNRLRINKNRIYFGPKLIFKGPIQYYANKENEFDYGLIIPRHELDTILFETARAAGATVFSPAEARTIVRKNGKMIVEVQTGSGAKTLRAPLVIGADGVESRVARSANLRRTDRRHIGVSQRADVEGIDVDGGEATVWFDEEIAPGYGWMFPMPGGRANVGVGFSSETSHRFKLSVRDAFETALARLRIRHPGCANARLSSKPIGGVVKTYGAIDRNHFDGGLLIGDAGSFVDPLTGEGITHGMESAILALPTIIEALNRGRFEAADLARFDADFHRYFDPAMRYLELSAALVSNRHMSEFWLRVGSHGHEEAADDPAFARISGSIFGGPSLQPLAASAQMWQRVLKRYADGARNDLASETNLSTRFFEDFVAFKRGWDTSQVKNPDWHSEWLRDVVARTVEVQKTIWTRSNPRPAGVFRFIGLEKAPDESPRSNQFPLSSPEVQRLLINGASSLLEAGISFLMSPPVQAPASHAEPRRRWRVKS